MTLCCHIDGCLDTTGTSLLCSLHRKHLTKYRERRIMNLWHDIVVDKGRFKDMYQCFHCEELFPRNMMVGDHFPFTKGSRPDLKFDIANGVPSCARCNISNAPSRKSPSEFL